MYVNGMSVNSLLNDGQYGGRGALLPHFSSPVAYQKGRGFGSLLRNLFRGVVPLFRKPIVKRGLRTVGKAAATALLEAGQRALQTEDPVSFGSALGESSRKHAQNLLTQARSQLGGKKRVIAIAKHSVSRRSSTAPSRRVQLRAASTLKPQKKQKKQPSKIKRARDIFSSY